MAEAGWVDPGVVPAALFRDVLLARGAVTVTAAAVCLLMVRDPYRPAWLVAAVVTVTGAQVAALTRWPNLVRWPVAILAVDSVGLGGVLVWDGPGIAYFCYAAGCAALAGALLGWRALPVWAAQAVLGFVVASRLVAATLPASEVATFVLAFPLAAVLAGIGVSAARAALSSYVDMVAAQVASVQRSAAASERVRLARELHDSVTNTLRGISFAALALPASLRRHPALAEQLAGAVFRGAEAAEWEARQLVAGLRLDNPNRDLAGTVASICSAWSNACGLPVKLDLRPVDPPIAVRYELTRILHEALVNVERHANARQVTVALAQSPDMLTLIVTDDGRGLPNGRRGPASGHFGISGMHERAKAVNGTLRIESGPCGGVRVSFSAPLGEPTGSSV
jgi:signal transduction histidine kinase